MQLGYNDTVSYSSMKIVWRSTAAKPDETGITFMPRFLGRGISKITCVTVRGYLAGGPGNSPPNITPIFNEIGTIARERISTKCHVTFEIAYALSIGAIAE